MSLSYLARSLPSRLADFRKAKAGQPVYYRGNGFNGHRTPLAVHPSPNGEPFNDSLRWIESPEDVFRALRFCDSVLPAIRHKGWFIDDDIQDETARGLVLTLPHGRFAAGIADPFQFDDKGVTGPAVVDFCFVTDNEREAARHADGIAESYAAREKLFQAEQRDKEREEELAASDPEKEEEHTEETRTVFFSGVLWGGGKARGSRVLTRKEKTPESLGALCAFLGDFSQLDSGRVEIETRRIYTRTKGEVLA